MYINVYIDNYMALIWFDDAYSDEHWWQNARTRLMCVCVFLKMYVHILLRLLATNSARSQGRVRAKRRNAFARRRDLFAHIKPCKQDDIGNTKCSAAAIRWLIKSNAHYFGCHAQKRIMHVYTCIVSKAFIIVMRVAQVAGLPPSCEYIAVLLPCGTHTNTSMHTPSHTAHL